MLVNKDAIHSNSGPDFQGDGGSRTSYLGRSGSSLDLLASDLG